MLRKLICILLMILLGLTACHKGNEPVSGKKKLQVVTTLFPLYDFTRIIAGDKADVTLLLPPGMEPHSFEPKPEDMVRISKADLFVYTNRYMEPWAATILKGIEGKKSPLVIDSSVGTVLKDVVADHGESHAGHGNEADHHGEGKDPHIWLDFANAQKMVANIAAGLGERDPVNREWYQSNAAAYQKQLIALDDRYRKSLANCRTRLFLHGGHYAFGYLADRYGLRYLSAYAVSANAEPTPDRLMEIVRQMKSNNIHVIYYEELISPRMAETLARETGATLMKLNGAHNVSREELNRGVTFLGLMDENLTNLAKGLQCR